MLQKICPLPIHKRLREEHDVAMPYKRMFVIAMRKLISLLRMVATAPAFLLYRQGNGLDQLNRSKHILLPLAVFTLFSDSFADRVLRLSKVNAVFAFIDRYKLIGSGGPVW